MFGFSAKDMGIDLGTSNTLIYIKDNYVNVDLDRMDKDTKKMRGDRPYIFTNVKDGDNVDKVVAWIKENVLLEGYK